MKTIEQKFELTFFVPEGGLESIEEYIERVGRVCYRSENKINKDSTPRFILMLKKRGHLSILEFGRMDAFIVTSRAIANELVRHRIGSYAQESTRYCKYGGDIEFIDDNPKRFEGFFSHSAYKSAAEHYNCMLSLGCRPEIARDVLSLGLATRIHVSYNFREWLHVFELRCSDRAHPDMRSLMRRIRKEAAEKYPSIFGEGNKEVNRWTE